MTDAPSPLMLARYRDDHAAVEALLAEGPELDVFEAAALGKVDRLRELLDADGELVHAWSPDGANALHFAAFFGHPEAVRLLLERGADPGRHARGFNHVAPINSAAAANSTEIVRMLLAAGADPDAEQGGGETALDAARLNGNEEMAALLSPDARG
jgi:adenosylhomocysteine nucleosidase